MPALANSTLTAINNLNQTAQIVIGKSDTRPKLRFHNPGPNDVIVAPLTAVVNGQTVPLNLTTTSLGGGYRIFANGGDRDISGNSACQAWQALVLAGVNQPLTISEE